MQPERRRARRRYRGSGLRRRRSPPAGRWGKRRSLLILDLNLRTEFLGQKQLRAAHHDFRVLRQILHDVAAASRRQVGRDLNADEAVSTPAPIHPGSTLPPNNRRSWYGGSFNGFTGGQGGQHV